MLLTLIEYAKQELSIINKNILNIIDKFLEQGYIGSCDKHSLSIVERLIHFKPITPLTGKDDEWVGYVYNKDQTTYRNKRCPSVFKYVDSVGNIESIEDADSTIVSDNGGITWFSNKRFRKSVTFPYLPDIHPEKVYIEYTEEVPPPGFTGDKYDIITDNPERIKALYERKRKEFDEVSAK